jgi:hypothetical protein
MTSLMDIIASMLFGSMLFMIVLTSNEIASETQTVYSGDMLVQEMLTSTVQLMEGEFRNMGYAVARAQKTVLSADSSSITYLSALDHEGTTPDTISYWLGNISELTDTQNEMDRFLYRQVNGTGSLRVGAVTVFRLRYFAQSGELLPTPVASDRLSEIYSVELSLEVQNPYAPSRISSMVQSGERSALYSSSLWQQTRLASQNLRR